MLKVREVALTCWDLLPWLPLGVRPSRLSSQNFAGSAPAGATLRTRIVCLKDLLAATAPEICQLKYNFWVVDRQHYELHVDRTISLPLLVNRSSFCSRRCAKVPGLRQTAHATPFSRSRSPKPYNPKPLNRTGFLRAPLYVYKNDMPQNTVPITKAPYQTLIVARTVVLIDPFENH